MARWLEVLAMYDMKIEHRQGRVHGFLKQKSNRVCSHCDRKNHRMDTHREMSTQTEEKDCHSETLLEICSSSCLEKLAGNCNSVSKTTGKFQRNDSDGSSDAMENSTTEYQDILENVKESGNITLSTLMKLQESDKVLGKIMTW